MPIEIPDLTGLDPSQVTAILAETVARLQEENPEIDFRAGPLHDLLLYNDSILEAARRVNTDRYRQSTSLLEIERDPTLADDDVVDAVLSNFRMTRKPGTAAQGSVTIVVSDNTTVSVGAGAVFEANGKQFVADRSYVAKREDAQINSLSDRLFVGLSDGNFAFTIEVTAVELGEESRISKDTAVLPQVLPTNFVRAYAANNFEEGRNVETNAELITRLQEGLACKALSGRVDMQAALRAEEQFADIVTTSIIGYGDVEMLRDAHTIFPVSLGGRVDWYLRSDPNLLRKALTKSAILVEKTPDGFGIWQFPILRDEAPGFYEVSGLRLPTAENIAGHFEILADNRVIDLSELTFAPDVRNLVEGAYSRYQATTIQFKDDQTATGSLALGATQDYAIEIAMQPLIAEVQDEFGSRDRRNAAGDLLVRAAVPCFISLSFVIYKDTDEDAPDVENIKTALASVVNHVGFSGRLSASTLHDTIHGFLSSTMSVSAIDMVGRIRRPIGDSVFLRSTEVLRIPHQPEQSVTSRTVQFFLAPEAIGVSVLIN